MSTQPNEPHPDASLAAGAPPVNARPRMGGPAPVVVAHELGVSDFQQDLRRLAPAIVISVLFHISLLGAGVLVVPRSQAEGPSEAKEEIPIATETQEEVRKDPFLTTDIDPS